MMASNQNNHESSKFPKIDLSKQTDMEIVSSLLSLFGFSVFDGMKIKEESSLKSGFVELAEDVMKDMENPFAKNLLMVAIKEWKLKKAS
jgi:hypothetical protein